MIKCTVLKPFTLHVPGHGMVVANVSKTDEPATVLLPAQYAMQRRERGYVDFDDADAAGDLEADAARPRSSKERRLLARAQRRGEQATRAEQKAEGKPEAASLASDKPKAKAKPKRRRSRRKAAPRKPAVAKAAAPKPAKAPKAAPAPTTPVVKTDAPLD